MIQDTGREKQNDHRQSYQDHGPINIHGIDRQEIEPHEET